MKNSVFGGGSAPVKAPEDAHGGEHGAAFDAADTAIGHGFKKEMVGCGAWHQGCRVKIVVQDGGRGMGLQLADQPAQACRDGCQIGMETRLHNNATAFKAIDRRTDKAQCSERTFFKIWAHLQEQKKADKDLFRQT